MKSLFAVALAIFIVGSPREGAAQNLSLKAGAAKVDVTPAESELPRNGCSPSQLKPQNVRALQ